MIWDWSHASVGFLGLLIGLIIGLLVHRSPPSTSFHLIPPLFQNQDHQRSGTLRWSQEMVVADMENEIEFRRRMQPLNEELLQLRSGKCRNCGGIIGVRGCSCDSSAPKEQRRPS